MSSADSSKRHTPFFGVKALGQNDVVTVLKNSDSRA